MLLVKSFYHKDYPLSGTKFWFVRWDWAPSVTSDRLGSVFHLRECPRISICQPHHRDQLPSQIICDDVQPWWNCTIATSALIFPPHRSRRLGLHPGFISGLPPWTLMVLDICQIYSYVSLMPSRNFHAYAYIPSLLYLLSLYFVTKIFLTNMFSYMKSFFLHPYFLLLLYTFWKQWFKILHLQQTLLAVGNKHWFQDRLDFVQNVV